MKSNELRDKKVPYIFQCFLTDYKKGGTLYLKRFSSVAIHIPINSYTPVIHFLKNQARRTPTITDWHQLQSTPSVEKKKAKHLLPRSKSRSSPRSVTSLTGFYAPPARILQPCTYRYTHTYSRRATASHKSLYIHVYNTESSGRRPPPPKSYTREIED